MARAKTKLTIKQRSQAARKGWQTRKRMAAARRLVRLDDGETLVSREVKKDG